MHLENWQYFKLRSEIKNLPLLEQRRAFLQHQLQHDRFLAEATFMQQQMQAQSAASAGGGKKPVIPPPPPPLVVNFLVVAGGGGGGQGGGGAGGLRTSFGTTSGGGASAESSLSSLIVKAFLISLIFSNSAFSSFNLNKTASGLPTIDFSFFSIILNALL